MINYLNPFKIFNDIENGSTYIKPFGIILGILLIIIDLIIVYFLENIFIKIFLIVKIKNNLLLNIFLFSLQTFIALCSLNIILYITKTKTPDINYCSNYTLKDFFYILIIILGFRFLYEGSIYQFKELLVIDLKLNSLLMTCIYAPFIEEFLYRGLILNGMLKKYNPLIAIFISSFLFGFMHFNFFQSLNAFFISLIIGIIYLKTKSIYLCIFLHFCNNILALFLPSFIFDNIIVHYIYIVLSILIGTCLFIYGFFSIKLSKRDKKFTNQKKDFNFFLDKLCE
ncbi:MAG: lysostaphin resistance A-like protein [Sarcina sp.]